MVFSSNIFLPIKTEESEESIYNCDEFPVDLQDIDILNLEFVDEPEHQDISQCRLSLPEIVVQSCEDIHHSDESGFHSVSSNTEAEEEDETREPQEVPSKLLTVPPRHKRRHESMSSETSYETSDDDGEWRPSPEKSRRRSYALRISESSTDDEVSPRKYISKRPTPQKRSPGTSCKMVQWIVSLLRSPKYNPSVITWLDEPNGVFTIKNTVKYAKLWGEKKNNKNMNYEKLSRGMRYYYRNGELEAITDQRLTYKFGPTASDFRALDSEDPNFQRKL